MNRSLIAVFALAASAIALPAAAHGGGGDKAKFPMPAAEFTQHMNARIEKWRAKLEKNIAEKNLPADQAQAARTAFDQGAAQVRNEAAKAAADGVVTKEEAQQVRQVAKTVHPHHGHHGDKSAPAMRLAKQRPSAILVTPHAASPTM
jgi:hypothetical protein